MARAVARMSVLSELVFATCQSNGTFIAMKAASANEEIESRKEGHFYTWVEK